jgi:hypothetical protein
MTIAFIVIGVCGETDRKFEFLVVDGPPQKTFKLWLYIYITLSSFIILHYFVFNK